MSRGFSSILVVLVLGMAVLVGILILLSGSKLWVSAPLQDFRLAPQALVEAVPNFDNLSLGDLPSFGDYRGIYQYNGHLLLTGYNRIVEYDSGSRKYIRQNDPKVLACVSSTTVIGSNLYVGCNGSYPFQETSTASVMWKVDLSSGRILKKYFGEQVTSLGGESQRTVGKKVNIDVVAQGTSLWISSWDGVMRMNTINDQLINYSKSAVFGNNCRPGKIYNDLGKITVLATVGSDCNDGVAIFNDSEGKWDVRHVDPASYLHDRGLLGTLDSPVAMPNYFAITKLYQDKYYLFANDGIYILKKGKFPEKIIDGKLENQGIEQRIYRTNDGRYLVYLAQLGRGPEFELPQIFNTIGAYLVDLQGKVIVNLTRRQEFYKATTPAVEELVGKIKASRFVEEGTVVNVVDSGSKRIFAIDLSSHTITLYPELGK